MLKHPQLLSSRMRTIGLGLICSLFAGCSQIPTQQVSQVIPGGQQQSSVDASNQPAALADISQPRTVNTRWQLKVPPPAKGHHLFPPQLRNKHVYVAGADSVFAFGQQDGQKAWQQKLEENISAGVKNGKESLFIGTENGAAIALAPDTGATRWVAFLDETIVNISNELNDRVAFRTINGKIVLLSARTGDILWQNTESVDKNSLTLQGSSAPVLAGPFVIGAFDTGKLIAYEAESGQPAWSATIANQEGLNPIDKIADLDAQMATIGTALFTSSFKGITAGVDMREGKIGWKTGINSISGFTVNEQGLYTTDTDGLLYKLEPLTGKQIWKSDLMQNRLPNQPVLTDSQTLVITDATGLIHFHDTREGKAIARTEGDPEGYVSAATTQGNNIFTLGRSGLLSSLQLQ